VRTGKPSRDGVKSIDLAKVKEVAAEKMLETLEDSRQEKRSSARLAARYKPDTKPTLTFTSSHKGVGTQKLYAEQEIGFVQTARLEWNAMAPQHIASYFELRQYVYDKFKYAGRDPEERKWQIDGPYKPPYKNAQTVADQTSITFTDEPGFLSTGSSADNNKKVAGRWLELYTVSFYWEVTRLDTGQVWQSPVVTHDMTSPPNADYSDAPVNYAAAGDERWEIDLPPAS
jgi:hypothetical protein